MIRLRVSTLESFRRVVETEFGDEAELVERIIRGQWVDGPANWQMAAGTAWHHVLASNLALEPFGQHKDGITVVNGDYQFLLEDAMKAQDYVGRGVCEVTATHRFGIVKSLPTRWAAVDVEGTADWLKGLTIQDHKTKFSRIDVRDYEDSLQWRFYLLAHQASVFRYNLWDFREPKDGYCELCGVTSVRFWPYPGMVEECRSWVERFLDWAEGRGLMGYLSEKARAA